MASSWMLQYSHHRPLSASLDSRERGHGDALPLLVTQLLLSSPTADRIGISPCGGIWAWRPGPTLHAALCAKVALNAAPHNFQLALSLMQIYLCLGLPASALEIYRACDIKQVQHETLSYLVLPALAQLGAVSASDQVLVRNLVTRTRCQRATDSADLQASHAIFSCCGAACNASVFFSRLVGCARPSPSCLPTWLLRPGPRVRCVPSLPSPFMVAPSDGCDERSSLVT